MRVTEITRPNQSESERQVTQEDSDRAVPEPFDHQVTVRPLETVDLHAEVS